MSAASCLLSEEQFLCSICLDVFTHPVTIPCGHNYCKSCITQHWDVNDQCQCPMCSKRFKRRPELLVNTFISEMAAHYRKSAQQKASSSPDQHCAKPGEVPCDVCTGTQLKALKSCLVCLASYCETHLEPHQRLKGLKSHKLIDPVENLEDRMCKKHDRPLELFCKTDQMCVCQICTESDHKFHHIVPLTEGYEGKKTELGKTEAELHQMIQQRQVKIQEINHSVELSKEDATREISDSVLVFSGLMQSVERGQAELIQMIEEEQKTTEKQGEGFIKELEQEISELLKRTTEVEQLSHTEDQLHLLQSFPSLNPPPPTRDWTEVRVHRSSYEGSVRKAVSQLEETLSKEMEKLLGHIEVKRVQQYAVDVTLDPDTANPHLMLSEDGKQVHHGDVKKNIPNNTERFSLCVYVLGKQSFSSGRFYYEVQVKGKTDWRLGVARESINRKGGITARPKKGYWTIWLRNGHEYTARAASPVRLSLKTKPQKVGVFVDYEEGLVSFYDVDAAALIYSFTGCTFTEKLYSLFSPHLNQGGKNSAPLIISPVNQSQCVDMSAASCLLSEEQFLCSICLDVFTHPVTIPCGHNYCKSCITQHWDVNDQCRCPMCSKHFMRRPELLVNTLISEMAAPYRKSAQQKASSSPDQHCAKPGEVPCDVCTGTQLKALKSCLVCLASYCETHLEPHQRIKGLKSHKLIDPVENLEDRMCKKHDRPLGLFCKTDQMCVCQICNVLDHKLHHIVPLTEEYEGKKTELGKTEADLHQMIQQRQVKIQEINQSVELSKEEANREILDSVLVFSGLMQSVERGQAELIQMIEEKQKTTEKQGEGFIKELEQEISELLKRTTEVKQLSHTEDQLHLLQSFPSLNPPPPTRDWTEVRVHRSSYEGSVRKAVSQLEETLSKEMEKLLGHIEVKRVQQYAVDVTLDPDTANPHLILSEDGKQVHHGDVKKNIPNNTERFSLCVYVLGKQSFSSGRFYYEVQVKGKTEWSLGVVRESINRKGGITARPKNGYWTIWLRNGNEYTARAASPVRLSLKTKPQKVGVFVDYEEGLVSFYDVDAAALIYSFTGCTFTEKLYSLFSPRLNDGGKNSAPLIISPVNQTD
ncbi:uncharacterized protein ACN63O_017767 [Diretmus argenteus]